MLIVEAVRPVPPIRGAMRCLQSYNAMQFNAMQKGARMPDHHDKNGQSGESPLILSRLRRASYPQRLEIEDKMEQKKVLKMLKNTLFW